MSSGIDVVVFDLGGVVVQVCRTWEEACARAGIPLRSPERFARFELREQRSALSDAYQSGRISSRAYFTGIAEATDWLYTAEDVERIHRAWVMEDYAGVEALIHTLHERGLRTACLSNTNDAHWQGILGAHGDTPSASVLALGTHLVSHEMNAVKPDRAVYELATSRLDVAPERVLFFDDLEPNVAGAIAYGWRAHRIDHDGDTSAQMHAVLTDLGVLS